MKAILYTTTNEGTMNKDTVIARPDEGVENEVLNIYEEVEYQTMEGFGGALTDAVGYVFSQLSKEQQDEMIQMYFSPEHMGYTQVRIPMDSCDASVQMYEAASDEEDEELKKFSFADTEKHIIPMLDAAERTAGKRVKIMLSPWSPPAYMKTNGKRTGGGSLKPEYRKRWAEYLCRYVEEFKSRGYEVARMSVQNEPKAVQTWDSCVYTVKEEQEFLRDYLAPALNVHGLGDVELFIWDHNKERLYERARDIIDDTTNDLVAGVAFHWYSGDHFEALDLMRKVYPDKKLILSESCIELGKYAKADQVKNAERLAHDMMENLNHGMEGFYDWNMMLDSEGGPNHVRNLCEAPYMFDMEKKELEERRILRYYWHFSHFIKPGAVRLASTRFTDKVDFTVWKNVDGEIVFVLMNRSEEKFECHLRMRGEEIVVALEAHSIMSGVIRE